MISLDQIHTLDEKVKKAVEVINQLRQENLALKERLQDYQTRIEDLEKLIETFKNDQGMIEEGILNAIEQLDNLEGDRDIPAAPQTHGTISQASPSSEPDESSPDETGSDESDKNGQTAVSDTAPGTPHSYSSGDNGEAADTTAPSPSPADETFEEEEEEEPSVSMNDNESGSDTGEETDPPSRELDIF